MCDISDLNSMASSSNSASERLLSIRIMDPYQFSDYEQPVSTGRSGQQLGKVQNRQLSPDDESVIRTTGRRAVQPPLRTNTVTLPSFSDAFGEVPAPRMSETFTEPLRHINRETSTTSTIATYAPSYVENTRRGFTPSGPPSEFPRNARTISSNSIDSAKKKRKLSDDNEDSQLGTAQVESTYSSPQDEATHSRWGSRQSSEGVRQSPMSSQRSSPNRSALPFGSFNSGTKLPEPSLYIGGFAQNSKFEPAVRERQSQLAGPSYTYSHHGTSPYSQNPGIYHRPASADDASYRPAPPRHSGSTYDQPQALPPHFHPDSQSHPSFHRSPFSSGASNYPQIRPEGQMNGYAPSYMQDHTAMPHHSGTSRKRRGNLPKETTDKLRTWFHSHLSHPYPTEDEKQTLMEATGLAMNQISNWFINARRRQLPGLINGQNAVDGRTGRQMSAGGTAVRATNSRMSMSTDNEDDDEDFADIERRPSNTQPSGMSQIRPTNPANSSELRQGYLPSGLPKATELNDDRDASQL